MQGFAVALQPDNILLMLLGVSLGVLIGVLPGLGGANGIAILLPLTFAMPPVSAIIMLSCIYWGALFGGAFTSSFFGALVAVVMITFVAPVVAGFALRFGPPEFFAVMFLSFACFVGMS